MSEMTPEQRSAVEPRDRPFALIAGAGSGKTTVLVERYRKLLARGLKPRQILTVTFTQDAAAQLRERIAERLASEGSQGAELASQVVSSARIGTIHSFCRRVLDQFGGHLGFAPVEGIVDPLVAAVAFEREYERWVGDCEIADLESLLGRLSRDDLYQTLRDLWGHHRTPPPPTAEAAAEELTRLAAPLWKRLDETLFDRGLYTFADLERCALRLLSEVPEVAAALDKQIRALLIDEFQDTSPLQWRILRAAVGGNLARVFVVGDPKQSIYGFREADVGVFLRTSEEFASGGGEIGALTANFRSHPRLLDDVNRLAEPLFAASAVPYSEMRPGREPSAEAEPRVSRLRYGKDEPEAVAESVRKRVATGIAADNFALLFRVSDRIGRFQAALAAVRIPSVARRITPLFRSLEALDLAHALEALADPLDDFTVAAFLRSPFVGWTPAELGEILRIPGESLFERVAASGRLPGWVALAERGPSTVGEALIGIAALGRGPGTGEPARKLLGGLLPAETPLFEAVERLRRWRHEEPKVETTGDSFGVRLMTVHGAKGLEFDHVYLVDTLRTAPRISPPYRRGADGRLGLRYREGGVTIEDATYRTLSETAKEREAQEARRILYVALTRARETLTISLPGAGTKIPKESWASWLG